MKHVSNHPCFPLWPLIFNLGGQLGYSIYSLTVYLRCTYTDGHCKATRGGVAYGVRCSQSGGNTAHPSFHSHRPPTHLPPACSATYRLPNTHSQRPENVQSVVCQSVVCVSVSDYNGGGVVVVYVCAQSTEYASNAPMQGCGRRQPTDQENVLKVRLAHQAAETQVNRPSLL